MKRFYKILFLMAIMGFASCNKYPDGPSFSLESKKSRIANVWMVDKFLVNGIDKTAEYRALITKETIVFFKGGSFQYSEVSNWSWAVPEYEGKWNLIHSKEDIEMIPDNSAVEYRLYKIMRLKSDEMWLQREVTPDSIIQYNYVTQTAP